MSLAKKFVGGTGSVSKTLAAGLHKARSTSLTPSRRRLIPFTRSLSHSSMTDSMWNRNITVDLFPVSAPLSELRGYKSIKTVHFIRHAEGTHNVNESYRETRNLDARLTETGIQQCRALADALESEHPIALNADLIISSPLTRCIQTALMSMEPVLTKASPPPVLAVESLRETVNYISDKRRKISEISADFPNVDFSFVTSDSDTLWEYYEDLLGGHESYVTPRESTELYKVAERGRDFFQFLHDRPETNVVVCGHSAYFRCIWNFGLGEEVPSQRPQILDRRSPDEPNIPVVRFVGDASFEETMRADYANCELRSKIVAFKV